MGVLKDTIFCDIRSDYNQNQQDSFLYRYLKSSNEQLKEKCTAKPEMEADYIHKAATDLMYNHGYPLAEKTLKTGTDLILTTEELERKERARLKRQERAKKKRQTNGVEKKKKNDRKRSNNTMLELIDAWYEDMLIRKRGNQVSLFSDEHISEADFQELFEELNKSKKTNAIIPVKIDPLSCQGLYIIGKDLFPKEEFQYDKSYSCGFSIITLYQINTEEDYGASLYFGLDPAADLGAPPNVREALKFFEHYINEGRADSGYLEEVWKFNSNMPKNCPESLKIYFADYAIHDDFAVNTEEDMFEAKADYGAEVN